jgi:quercetin dioxygenase-like cupin family protein
MDFKKVVVSKPWGYEYLIYESDDVALWLLNILPGKSTSLHSHPLKTTGLVLLSGEAELRFIADSKIMAAPDKQMIRRGLFHATRALSNTGAVLLEIETPKDKSDLVRLSDDFGREAKGYETETNFKDKPADAIWIKDPETLRPVTYANNEAQFEVQRVEDIMQLRDIPDAEIVMFLKGGLVKKIDNRLHLATVPGDVGRGKVLREVARQMDFLASDTVILRV